MLKLLILLWLVAGTALAGAYSSPPVQRWLRHAQAEEYLQLALAERARASAICGCPDRSPTTQSEAPTHWLKALEAAEAAIATFPDPGAPGALMARVVRAEAWAQTGKADLAFEELRALEKLVATTNDANVSEAFRATMAKTEHQIAIMIRQESSDDGAWIRYSESACLYYQDLLKNAPDEATRDVYRRNLACVMQFRYGAGDETNCWSLPPVRTVDCKKKLRRLDREPPKGGGGGGGGGGGKPGEFKPSPSDLDDPVRKEFIKKTQQGEDKGK
jgi:hypothetical protein